MTELHFREHVLGDHRARWFATVDEAYREMERCIEAASCSIRFETYLLRQEGPAAWLLSALLRARLRGVDVWVLIDAFGSEGINESLLAPLRDAGAQVAVFNPHRLLRRVFRNHRKLLACDGKVAVVGGFNVGPEYAGNGVTHGWCDTGVWIGGPVVATLERSFDAMFELAPFGPRAFHRFRQLAHGIQPQTGSDTPVTVLLAGPAMPGTLWRTLRRDLQTGRRISIASAYFLPAIRLRRLLYRAARRAGRVRVLLAGTSDVPLARLATEHLYARLLRRHVRLLEYQPQVLHAKLIIIDDIVHVGSCNLDRRSRYINYELQLRFDWPELAADARTWFQHSLKHAKPVSRHNWHRQRTLLRSLLSRIAYLLLARLDPLVARRGIRSLS